MSKGVPQKAFPGIDPPAYRSLPDFWEAHGIGKSLGYELSRAGLGPATVRVGVKKIVLAEAAQAWRRRAAELGTLPSPRSAYKKEAP
jgi:hypothetical protein